MTATATEIETVKALQPGPRPDDFRKGYCDFRFSELAAWKGYTAAKQIADFLLYTEVLWPCMKLHITYTAFCEAEKELAQ